mmetsp:Transcript_1207/g.3266  ORF Transcript_1207/g.3266 Transcript_1207/m.3266 type:complete len:200 (+) Transcript_1207:479-1078(+)
MGGRAGAAPLGLLRLAAGGVRAHVDEGRHLQALRGAVVRPALRADAPAPRPGLDGVAQPPNPHLHEALGGPHGGLPPGVRRTVRVAQQPVLSREQTRPEPPLDAGEGELARPAHRLPNVPGGEPRPPQQPEQRGAMAAAQGLRRSRPRREDRRLPEGGAGGEGRGSEAQSAAQEDMRPRRLLGLGRLAAGGRAARRRLQ